MGIYLNPNNTDFYNAVNYSEIYVDKTELINYTNNVLFGEQKFICVSRPRRFGKSMAANMLTAYYSRGCDSREMFSCLKIAKSENFEKHLNKYNVIRFDMQKFFNRAKTVDEMLETLQKRVLNELRKTFEIDANENDLPYILEQIFDENQQPFIFIIDEWDCVLRSKKNNAAEQKKYLDFLCDLFKGQSYVALAYMTGILPIKKYGEHSAINMFDEYSVINAKPIEEFTGFTEKEVALLCEKYHMSFEETKKWYDGYCLNDLSIYNPKSVVAAMMRKKFDNYWTSTETYEALKVYIEMNFDGLKDTIIKLLAGEKVTVDITTFTNDMVTFVTKDDVLTLLIHLGYLTYDFDAQEVSIPNYEVSQQFASTVKVLGWSEIANALTQSSGLLKATLACDEEKVAEFIEQAHSDNTSILKYNDENSLSCVISIAYYSAKSNYVMYRELPSGKGFADLVFIPRKNTTTPALIIELKCDKSAETAIEQIKNRNYADCLKDYNGEILLVGINYDKNDESKKHTCRIEKVVK